jgi:acetyl esterase/lipase
MASPSDSGAKKLPPLSKIQAATTKEPGTKGKTWIAKAKIPAPPAADEGSGTGLREVVFQAVDDLAPHPDDFTYTKPDLVDVEVEWHGYRPDAAKDEPLPPVSEAEKYRRLMAEPCRTSDLTILYFHGGAYYLCDPITHRALTSRIAKESHARVCSVRYRLAPRTAFPGQLLDVLQVYLSLLYPPPGSLHTAVAPENVVFAGDSAGGNLSFALLQLLLQLHRSSPGVPIVKFHGTDVHVPLPAGVSANSGWFDIARSMPSIKTNATYDYLPQADTDFSTAFPDDPAGIWPSDPPRGDLFCDLSLLDHPLVTVMLAEDWSNSPPLWFCCGDEMLADEICLVAQKASEQGVSVRYERYEAMPHCFQMLLPGLPNSGRCVRSWGEWARDCVEGKEKLGTKGTWIPAKKGEETDVDVRKLDAVGMEEAKRLVGEEKKRRILAWEKEGKALRPSL